MAVTMRRRGRSDPAPGRGSRLRAPRPRAVVTLVHGTWARGTKWPELSEMLRHDGASSVEESSNSRGPVTTRCLRAPEPRRSSRSISGVASLRTRTPHTS